MEGCDKKNGYGSFNFNGTIETASRVAFFLTHGAIPQNLFVLHHCDKPLCVNPEHLYAGTHKENMNDRDKRGRTGGIAITSKGEGNIKAKLTEQDVLAIRASTEGSRKLGKQSKGYAGKVYGDIYEL